jgi:hypothetical protein
MKYWNYKKLLVFILGEEYTRINACIINIYYYIYIDADEIQYSSDTEKIQNTNQIMKQTNDTAAEIKCKKGRNKVHTVDRRSGRGKYRSSTYPHKLGKYSTVAMDVKYLMYSYIQIRT